MIGCEMCPGKQMNGSWCRMKAQAFFASSSVGWLVRALSGSSGSRVTFEMRQLYAAQLLS